MILLVITVFAGFFLVVLTVAAMWVGWLMMRPKMVTRSEREERLHG